MKYLCHASVPCKIAVMWCILMVGGLSTVNKAADSPEWKRKLEADLPVLGHRNWIVVADAAYPAQTRLGIEVITSGATQLEVVEAVLSALDKTKHVRPNIFLDAELSHVSEKDAPGIEAYRQALMTRLKDRNKVAVLHMDLIKKLDDAAKSFRVLVFKTDMTLPYTSVFLELDCGYWSPEAEKRLRSTMEKQARKSQ